MVRMSVRGGEFGFIADAVFENTHAFGVDARPQNIFGGDVTAFDGERGQPALEFIEGHTAIEQRGQRHVARDAGKTIEIRNFHNDFEALCVRKTDAANAAAPKPLSILTTATPLAHELSIPSSAAKPPNEAP